MSIELLTKTLEFRGLSDEDEDEVGAGVPPDVEDDEDVEDDVVGGSDNDDADDTAASE